MIQRLSRRRHQAGFTLIELLVVVVILGILSAVVVFAVRGTGDKGDAAARATDERTIRTAEEAYCAKAGQYANMNQLTGNAKALDGNTYKFLSERSTYNDVNATPPPGGQCNGWSYALSTPAGPGSTTTTTTGGPANPVCQPGAWCVAAPPTGRVAGAVQLLDGRVLALKTPSNPDSGTPEIYNPNVVNPTTGLSGTWTPAAIVPSAFAKVLDVIVLIEGTPAQCGISCGSVLVHYSDVWRTWYLYNPTTNTWSSIEAKYGRDYSAQAILLTGTGTPGQCGTNCGKVLVFGQGADQQLTGCTPPNCFFGSTPPVAEIFDPSTTPPTFRLSGTHTTSLYSPIAARLPDGKVLAVSRQAAKVFDPRTELWADNVAQPTASHTSDNGPAVTLPDGKILVGGSTTEVYDSVADQWTTVTPSCGASCQILTSLADGRVLAASTSGSGLASTVYLFDLVQKKWLPTGSPANPYSLVTSTLLIRGACPGALCNKVLAAGGSPYTGFAGLAELYTPP